MVKILDCTLRDGGHLNNWDFSQDCILDTLSCAEKSNIDYFEIGYKLPEFVNSSTTKLVVMVDCKNIQPVSKFADCVRLACYPEQIQTAINAVENYKEQGFEVFLHLMTADKFNDYEFLKKWKNKNILTSIYFADSFGAFMPCDVERIYKNLQNCGFEKISFHAHNNLQQALINTAKAIELGAYSVDASVFGMGRGAGNLPMEVFLKYLNRNNNEYLNLIEKYYLDFSEKYKWGYNCKSLTDGLRNIHPINK